MSDQVPSLRDTIFDFSSTGLTGLLKSINGDTTQAQILQKGNGVSILDLGGGIHRLFQPAPQYANFYATGGNGTAGSPWTSPSGTGGILEAKTALGSLKGTIYCSAGYYHITATINLTQNGGIFVGSGGVPLGASISLIGDGPGETIFVCDTGAAPVIDITGSSFWQLRGLDLIEGSVSPSVLAVYAARAAANAFNFNNRIDQFHCTFSHNAAANGGNGSIGLYFNAIESSLVTNTIIYADTPIVCTGDNTFGIVSAFQPLSAFNFDTTNTFISNQWSGYNQALLLQGHCDSAHFVNCTLLKTPGATGTYAVTVLNSPGSPASAILDGQFEDCQLEGWDQFLTTTARLDSWKFAVTLIAGTGPTIQLVGANSGLIGCQINVNTAGGVQPLIGDNGVGNTGALANEIYLYTGSSINAPSTPALANHIKTSIGNPTITWASSKGLFVQNGLSVAFPGLQIFANNAAALAGGLFAGDLYRTNADPDTVCVVH
jgi:hypothetical protein